MKTDTTRCIRISLAGCLTLVLLAASAAQAVDYRFLDGSNRDLATISFQADLMIGEDEDSELILGQVSSVCVDSAGGIYLAESRIPCVYRLDSDGQFVARFGQEGDGPGDLSQSFRFAMDSAGRIFLAGMGEKVHMMSTDWEYLGGFKRENPGSLVRSLAIAPNGTVAISTPSRTNQTSIDLYSSEHEYLRSFCDTFDKGTDWEPRFASSYAGGRLALGADGFLYFIQSAPYDLRKFTAAGELVASTTSGGAEFVPEPPLPEIDGDRVFFAMSWGTTGIAVLPDGSILTSAWRMRDDDSKKSLFCLYDSDLNLLARSEFEGIMVVNGQDGQGRVFLFCRGDEYNVVTRNTVAFR